MPAFALVSDSLYRETRVPVIEWKPDLEQPFDRMKVLILDRPLVRISDAQRDFILETVATTMALGAVLNHAFPDTYLKHPVGVLCQGLTDTERDHSVYKLEMCGVVLSAERFRVYLLGREFLLLTDH